ncbi:MAG: aminotransferase class I/II-fold pyridoxal phosphate-dependent enzyme [Oscillospiraceae bacterium]|jgi:DNA-binding transcriptional MocR family regulator|nr:aminotransferase class I/II-fold pyridoxal phosphate-dependent enzyme [Oscillospiraceae bacterium]
MPKYEVLSKEAAKAELEALRAAYNEKKALGLRLDMSRGKPCPKQLDLSEGLLDAKLLNPPTTESGFDCRNYGLLDGIPEAKRLFGEMLNVPAEQVIVCGNSSLQIMYDLVQDIVTNAGGEPIRWLCPVPGYDRHFSILESFGIEMIPIPMRSGGPDMSLVEQYCRDERVKGLICVPKYSNPEGTTYTEEVVRRFAALQPSARDFRVIWDNAYCVHDLYKEAEPLANVLALAKAAGTEDRFLEVTSFSKISFPGAGISCIAASPANIAAIKKRMNIQTISYDKLNQLRHVRYFKNVSGVSAHMKKHASILRPKFEAVLDILERDLSEPGFASWSQPRGGYFISLNILTGTAKRTYTRCVEAGVTLTPAGATYPLGHDPEDKNLRIAPTYPSLEELQAAAGLLCLCAKIAALEVMIA